MGSVTSDWVCLDEIGKQWLVIGGLCIVHLYVAEYICSLSWVASAFVGSMLASARMLLNGDVIGIRPRARVVP